MAALRVLPNPVPKGVLDSLLFLLGQGGLFLVQHPALLAVQVLHGIIDADVPEVQRVLQNPVGIGTGGAVGHIGVDITKADLSFARDVPLGGELRIAHLDPPAQIVRRIQQLFHELLDVLLVNPSGTQAHVNLRSVQVLGLGGFQGFHIGLKILWEVPGGLPGSGQLLPHIAGEVLVGGHISGGAVRVHRLRQAEDDAPQL